MQLVLSLKKRKKKTITRVICDATTAGALAVTFAENLKLLSRCFDTDVGFWKSRVVAEGKWPQKVTATRHKAAVKHWICATERDLCSGTMKRPRNRRWQLLCLHCYLRPNMATGCMLTQGSGYFMEATGTDDRSLCNVNNITAFTCAVFSSCLWHRKRCDRSTVSFSVAYLDHNKQPENLTSFCGDTEV